LYLVAEYRVELSGSVIAGDLSGAPPYLGLHLGVGGSDVALRNISIQKVWHWGESKKNLLLKLNWLKHVNTTQRLHQPNQLLQIAIIIPVQNVVSNREGGVYPLRG
jgi:hypothetical protein